MAVDMEGLAKYIDETLVKFQDVVEYQAKRLDDQESMISTLLMAYVEMFAAVDMVIKTTIKDYTPEDQEKFLEQFSEFRNTVLKSVQEASRSGVEGLGDDVAGAMEDLVPGDTDS